ncbi:hypothetical protein GJ744_008890 [Endocarpon pusillum]|uniref:Major facilitator superfamily (MFS) profile domain-containing protein n=1 Tax=Endocarpon pusillum TaxID=364733 RepID=A0A8H7EBA8_9EURO|nr:hypothetical protein GJ744_008890 [Endocarpon pusillum]
MPSLLQRFYAEIGLEALTNSPRDTKILCLQRLVRMFAYGGATVILALYLSSLGISEPKIGLFMTLTLLGDVVISLILTMIADGIGRRRMLGLGSLLMTASGIVFATCSNYWVLVAASVLGVISPSGNEIGPFKAIEESTISQLVSSKERSSVLAWYILFGSAGTAGGTISCGWATQSLQMHRGWTALESYRVLFWAYAVLGLVKLALSLILTPAAEQGRPPTAPKPTANAGETRPLLAEQQNGAVITPNIPSSPHRDHDDSPIIQKPSSTHPTILQALKSLLPPLSPESQSILTKLCLLFAIDSIASGLTPASWITYWLHVKFHLAEGSLGTLFFFLSILSSGSNLVASSIARRIGLIKTMVLTHMPASVALSLVPLPGSVVVVMALLAFRASTSSMDQAPRQAFLAGAVLPHERTAVMGMVNVVKTLSQSLAPVVTGALAGKGEFWVAFVVAGALKLAYDVLMLALFWGYRTQEERAEGRVAGVLQEEREQGTDEDRMAP